MAPCLNRDMRGVSWIEIFGGVVVVEMVGVEGVYNVGVKCMYCRACAWIPE